MEQFVPQGQQRESIPCRFIPLTNDGRTVEDLYRTASQAEMEEALAQWLRDQIQKIERERGLAPAEGAA